MYDLTTQLADAEHVQTAKIQNSQNSTEYHWAAYDECLVMFKKNQTRKQKFNELQLIVKVRTNYLGSGDRAENNGYLKCSNVSDVVDPEVLKVERKFTQFLRDQIEKEQATQKMQAQSQSK